MIMERAVLRVGIVKSVRGRTIEVVVDKMKNVPHLLYNGSLIKNVSVGSYIKINKGFERIIGIIEAEEITEDKAEEKKDYKHETNKIVRVLKVKIVGFLEGGKFNQGVKDLPLIDNICYILTKEEYDRVHNFVDEEDKPIEIGHLSSELTKEINVGVNSLFASHIGIFGNTGSGKSYSLASIYHSLFEKFGENTGFQKHSKFLLIDFNGEYSGISTITENKKVFFLSTRKKEEDISSENKLPLSEDVLINEEILSILSSATEKTQMPFIKRVIKLYKRVKSSEYPINHFRNILKLALKDVLAMSDKQKAYQLIDHLEEIINYSNEEAQWARLREDVDFQNTYEYFKIESERKPIEEEDVKNTNLYLEINNFEFPINFIDELLIFFKLRLIYDLFDDRAQFDHIAPAINKLESKANDLQKIVNFNKDSNLFSEGEPNLCIIDLNDCNIDAKKFIPLIVCKYIYEEQKRVNRETYKEHLNIIIDEAHNILSYTSIRESETWKDYRLETFEEIIKEGRKFGTFLTIASQRPNDISQTIISQLHNYFLHRLINIKDIEAIEKTVSYLDKVSFESLSILPTGTCILAGLAAKLPVMVKIKKLEDEKYQPNSKTIKLTDIWKKEINDEDTSTAIGFEQESNEEIDELPDWFTDSRNDDEEVDLPF